jgi:hypothetical protein
LNDLGENSVYVLAATSQKGKRHERRKSR